MPKDVLRISQVGTGSRAVIAMEVGKPSTQSTSTGHLERNLLSLKEYKRTTTEDGELLPVKFYSHKFIKTYINERYTIFGYTEIPT